jgi:hypothetical protein
MMDSSKGLIMDANGRSSWRMRVEKAYWVIVGIIGLGRPIVDRRSMYGDAPRNDPYSLDYDPGRPRAR